MIQHTMIVSFNDPIPDDELDAFLGEMRTLMTNSGLIDAFASRHHIPVSGDEHAPVFAASAVVQINFPDHDALEASFTVAGVEDLIGRWQARRPYKVVWVNHEPLP